jgi:hypothetical protein
MVHDMVNISWSLFPNYGSHYDPFITGLITWLTLVIVLVGWETKTFSWRRAKLTSREFDLIHQD